jgi:hypothetical protein
MADIGVMANPARLLTRRTLLGGSIAAMTASRLSSPLVAKEIIMPGEPFWPNDARLAVSFSLMFEAGGQPISGAGGGSDRERAAGPADQRLLPIRRL